MSQDDNTTRPIDDTPITATTEPVGTPGMAEGQSGDATAGNAPTIGTGTSIALGCVAGTIVLIAIGLLYILIVGLL